MYPVVGCSAAVWSGAQCSKTERSCAGSGVADWDYRRVQHVKVSSDSSIVTGHEIVL